MSGNISHSLTVSAVCSYEKFVALPDHTGDDRLHTEGAAALHEDDCVFRLGCVGQFQKLAADFKGNFFVVVIPCTMVKEHLLFYGVCCG